MRSLGLFNKQKKTGDEEENRDETTPQTPQTPETEERTQENQEKTYLKAMPLKDIADIEKIKTEIQNGNILILRITPLANKNIEDVKKAVNQLYEFTENIQGDIARLGEERIVICPPNIRIWREKPQIANQPSATAA